MAGLKKKKFKKCKSDQKFVLLCVIRQWYESQVPFSLHHGSPWGFYFFTSQQVLVEQAM